MSDAEAPAQDDADEARPPRRARRGATDGPTTEPKRRERNARRAEEAAARAKHEPHEPATPPEPELPLLERPADGVPDVIDTPEALAAAIEALAAADGPVAVDTERAQGFRYGAEAWLIQLRGDGAGTFLVDPAAFQWDLAALGAAIQDAEWIIHAASQDLPCLAGCGMVPSRLFDTELAGRLLHLDRVGLGPMVEQFFGLRLRKEHSAADWSTRPLPEDWLVYAALDVELLIELRARMAALLAEKGKAGWAAEEFQALAAGAGVEPPERTDPWRRTSGINTLKTPVQLAVVRELWQVRDEIARRQDKGPGRILQDAAIVDMAALVDPRSGDWPTRESVRALGSMKRRNARRFEANWLAAIDAVKVLPRSKYPPRHVRLEGPPAQPRSWEARHPAEFARWQAVRPVSQAVAEELDLPAENLVSPAVLRQLAWAPPETLDAEHVGVALVAAGARAWQAEHLAAPLAEALSTLAAA